MIALLILLRKTAGVDNLGWLLIVNYLTFALGFGYFAWCVWREMELE